MDIIVHCKKCLTAVTAAIECVGKYETWVAVDICPECARREYSRGYGDGIDKGVELHLYNKED